MPGFVFSGQWLKKMAIWLKYATFLYRSASLVRKGLKQIL